MLQGPKPERTDKYTDEIKSCSDGNHIFWLFAFEYGVYEGLPGAHRASVYWNSSSLKSGGLLFWFKSCGNIAA